MTLEKKGRRIGIEEAGLRAHMTEWCSSKRHHTRCRGYYVKSVQPWGRELDFCNCECHSTRKGSFRPSAPLSGVLRTNTGVSGEGDS